MFSRLKTWDWQYGGVDEYLEKNKLLWEETKNQVSENSFWNIATEHKYFPSRTHTGKKPETSPANIYKNG